MGKQTAVAMTEKDEEAFLCFVRGTAEVKLLRLSAPSPDEIWVDEFMPRQNGHWQYFIWNTCFRWKPKFSFVKSGERAGWVYIANTSTAPLLEYDRHNFNVSDGLQYGRVYWAKDFAAVEPLAYDVQAFDKWYMTIVRWIRKNGKRQSKMALSTYYLKDAWEKTMNQA